jgi:hypothetical protein
MSVSVRQWTESDQENLFEDYLRSAPGNCPVCSFPVRMTMSNLGKTVTLLLTCEGCGNRATVNRAVSKILPAMLQSQPDNGYRRRVLPNNSIGKDRSLRQLFKSRQ